MCLSVLFEAGLPVICVETNGSMALRATRATVRGREPGRRLQQSRREQVQDEQIHVPSSMASADRPMYPPTRTPLDFPRRSAPAMIRSRCRRPLAMSESGQPPILPSGLLCQLSLAADITPRSISAEMCQLRTDQVDLNVPLVCHAMASSRRSSPQNNSPRATKVGDPKIFKCLASRVLSS